MTRQTKISIPLFITALVIGFLAGMYMSKPKPEIIYQPREVVKRDTTVQLVYQEPIIIEAPAKIIIRCDTISENKYDTVFYETPAFTACLDTIVQEDTINILFDFPEKSWVFKYLPRPDSVQTLMIYTETMIERPWWEMPAYILGGATIGFLLGNTK